MLNESAEIPASEEEDTLGGMFLTFVIGGESYGLPIRSVTEIIGLQEITPIPDVPAYVRGIINLRGKVIPVMDVRLRFSMNEREYDARTCIVVVQVRDSSVGLVVDTVSEVVSIPDQNIEAPPQLGDRRSNDAIQGVGKAGDEIKLLLNVEMLVYGEQLRAAA